MTRSLSDRDSQFVWHPYTQRGLEPQPLVIKEAEGVYLIAEDGTRYLDGISSWWVALHGHRHPLITERVREQLLKCHHVVFAGCTHEPAVQLAEKALGVLPSNQSKVFFTDNGSSAVEASIKMALQYWQNKGLSQRNRILSLENGYHGDTLGAMSVGGKTFFNRPFHKQLFETTQIPTPYESVERTLACLERELTAGDVAAFIYEPLLQGAAGMRTYRADYLQQILCICKRYKVLCIADEVFTGFWKTGTRFASDQTELNPDMVIMSKALTGGSLPLALLSATEDIHAEFVADTREKMFLHGHTFTANPLGCVAALASLELMETEEFAENINRVIELQAQFATRIATHPAVESVRTLGMVVAFDLITDGETGYGQSIRDEIFSFCLERGLFLRPLGSTVYLLPPSSISDGQSHQMYEIVVEYLSSYANKRL